MTNVRVLALITALLPFVAIHGTYVISAAQGFVPWCFPYIDSCTSISATGRYGAAFYVFKATIIPQSVFLALFWLACFQWLMTLGDIRRGARLIPLIGIIGAIFLIAYAVALGAAGDHMALQRRIGIIVYFMFTYLAQLLLTWRLGRLELVDPTRKWQLLLCYTLLAIGLATVLLQLTIDNYADYEDAVEWVAALLIQGYFLLIWRAWGKTNFRLLFASESPPKRTHP